jgi:predicted phosphohydrolase
MRLIAVSDTHGRHDLITDIPDGDILVHAGDFMNSGLHPEEILSFNRWLAKRAIKHRLVCGGNHDRLFQLVPRLAREVLTDATYLENTGVTIDGESFWASPYTPEFLRWAFMYPRGTAARQYWDQIPYDLAVLITHGPPFGILDQAEPGGENHGCKELLKAVKVKRPKVHIFGHIHGGAGTFDNGITRFVNSAFLNERYQPAAPAGKIHVIDI